MKSYNQSEVVVTGLGVTSAVGQGKSAFFSALIEGRHAFGVMKRDGRQIPKPHVQEDLEVKSKARIDQHNPSAFLGAEISSLVEPVGVNSKILRTSSWAGIVALATVDEAWREAQLDEVDSTRIGLIVGGSNIQQRDLVRVQEKYRGRLDFLPPTYSFTFMDSDLCGLITQSYGIQGFGFTLGGASASGQLAIIQAIEAVQSGRVDVCIALGALMDLSYWECQGFRSVGAMGSDRYFDRPESASRPFDQNRDGFIFGESCAAVVVERSDSIIRKAVKPYARILGWSTAMDGNRNPNPSLAGEVSVLQNALRHAAIPAGEIDYINPHGSGSIVGDEVELQAINQCKLQHAYINATKSIVGHGLTAAGAVELVATILQMRAARLHPTINLDNPIEPSMNWIRNKAISAEIKNAINLSFGFGGINTAVCLQRC